MAERYNVIRPTVAQDFYETGGAPKWAKYKISFRTDSNYEDFRGTKYYRSMADAKKALANKQKLIVAAREAKKAPLKIIDPKTYADNVHTRIKGVGLEKISTTTKDNVTTKTYRDRATGKITKKYFSKLIPGKEYDSVADATKANKEYRIKNPIKNPPPDLKTLDAQKRLRYEKKQQRSADIKARGGYPAGGPFAGTPELHKGHAGNIRGKELITGDRLVYTPRLINQMMSGDEGPRSASQFTDLDYKIEEASNKIEEIKKRNISATEKRKLLNIEDTKLMKYSAQSDGYKVVTLSDGNTYGGFARPLQSMDPMSIFPNKTEKEIGALINKYKNMKITANTSPKDVQMIMDVGLFQEGLKTSRQAGDNAVNELWKSIKASGQCRSLVAKAVGGTVATCEAIVRKDPEGSARKILQMEETTGPISKVKNAASSFLNFAKRGGKFGAIAAAGAATAGFLKTYVNDDPTTYLSDENQQKNMLISMITDPMVDQPDSTPEILDYQLPAIGATAAAGTAVTAPSTIEAARSTRFGKKPSGYTKTALKTLGRGLAATGTPLGLAAFEPLHIAGQVQQGDSLGEIATNPWNYAGLAFADDLSKFTTKGLGPGISKAMRLGISPAALRIGSRFLGLPGLALSLGISGYEMYDDYKKKRGMFSEE